MFSNKKTEKKNDKKNFVNQGAKEKKKQISVKDKKTNIVNKDVKIIKKIDEKDNFELNSTNLHKTGNLDIESIQFASGNPFVEVTNGIIHYFNEFNFQVCEDKNYKSELILMLQVPISISTQELVQFTGPVNQTIEKIRIIRDSKPNQYMALIKFRNQVSADDFFKNFNGVQFNSIEPEICKLAYVDKLEFMKDDDPKGNDELTNSELCMIEEQSTCTVCLEKMNMVSDAILTILCGHSFHTICLMQWIDQSCPLCRYSQTPEHVPDNYCFECGIRQESLWMCITCGHIGCGRYIKGHAYLHFNKTSHNFAMQVGQTSRVWDYAADNYVNRLLQANDGKPVEVVGNSNELTEKLDAVQLEYTYLLTNQLESQRNHYESLIKKSETDYKTKIEELTEKNSDLEEKLKEALSINEKTEKEKDRLDKKYNAIDLKYRKCISELKEEKELGNFLLEKQKSLEESSKVLENKIVEKNDEIEQLKEQVRDLMIYVEVQSKLNNSNDPNLEEIKDGKIIISNPEPSVPKTKIKNRKKK